MQDRPYMIIPIALPHEGGFLNTKVSPEDFLWLSQSKWQAQRRNAKTGFYAARSIWSQPMNRCVRVLMHREILGLKFKDGIQTDHENGDTLDNRRENLRSATAAQNAQNKHAQMGLTSRFRGVYWFAQTGRWSVRCQIAGHTHCLGYFDDEEEAGSIAARFRAEHMLFATN